MDLFLSAVTYGAIVTTPAVCRDQHLCIGHSGRPMATSIPSGGTVKILPGVYRFHNVVYLQNKVRILGSGQDSIIIKEPSITARLVEDSDWFDQELTFADPKGLQIGDGICIRTRDPPTGGPEFIKRTLVARSGARFKLDVALRKNVWPVGEPAVSSLFPLFSGENIADATIENIALDGNKANKREPRRQLRRLYLDAGLQSPDVPQSRRA